ncbi:MAG: GlsB/YeaQ/YmgE family stress response membrane protein [Candidatus Saccharimonadales bacterium]
MSVIVWIIFGGLAGLIASALLDTDHTRTTLGHVLSGIIGALIGGSIMNTVGYNGLDGFNLYSVLMAVFGAMAGLLLFRTFMRNF